MYLSLWLLIGLVQPSLYSADDICSAQSLAVCLARLGAQLESDQIAVITGNKGSETSLLDLADCATELGVAAVGFEWSPNADLSLLWSAPGVARIFLDSGSAHFVALVGTDGDRLLVVDYPNAPAWISEKGMRKTLGWNGSILHFALDEETIHSGSPWKFHLVAWGIGLVIVLILAGLSQFRRHQKNSNAVSSLQTNTLNRDGFTIIELLVSLFVISLLLSLLFPAIQRARETAARTQCVNRLKQIGVACHAFESSHDRFPRSDPASLSTGREILPVVSAHTELLPWLDHANIYDRVDVSDTGGSGIDNEPPTSSGNVTLLETVIRVYQCPWDNAPDPHLNYRISFGTSPEFHETRPIGPDAALRGFSNNTPSEITDGLSNTAAFAEKLAGDQNPASLTAWRDSVPSAGANWRTPEEVRESCSLPIDPQLPHNSYGGYAWVISGISSGGYNHILTPNSRIPDCTGGSHESPGAFTARSLHPGGVSVLLADGAVRFISEQIDQSIWSALGTANGGESSRLEF